MSKVIAFRRKVANDEPTANVGPDERILDGLRSFLKDHPMTAGVKNADELTAFERALEERFRAARQEVMAELLKASDVDADAIEIQGKVHRRVLRASQTYMTTAGEVVVERWLYKDRSDGQARSVSPMELKLGVVEGFWTPAAAKHGAWVVAQMTPKKAEELFERVGSMKPSKSSLDRLPKALSDRWEQARDENEQVLREAIVVPEGARSVAVSIDGVMAPVDGGNSPVDVRNKRAAEGLLSKGPAGYRELGCATLAFCDDKGDLVSAIRFGRAPESKKRTLKETLARDLAHVLSANPDLKVVKIADAGGDNWEYFATLPEGPEVLDFFHATEHLSAAIAAAYGDGTTKSRHKFEELRERLLEDTNGVDTVIKALAYLKSKHPHAKRIATELSYFRKNRKRMQYAEWKKAGYMIGSGIVEAACKTLVAQRLKLSGMRWSSNGAQAILTMRGWDQSDRFDEAWALVAATYEREVHLLANVLDLTPTPEKKRRPGSTKRASG